MTLFDWLMSPTGQELQHALIVLILAGSAYVTYLAKRQADSNAKLLNGHLEAHMSGNSPQNDVVSPTEPAHLAEPH